MWSAWIRPGEARLIHVVLADGDRIQTFSVLRTDESRIAVLDVPEDASPIRIVEGPWRGGDRGCAREHPSKLFLPVPALCARHVVSARVALPKEIDVSCQWEDRAASRMRVTNGGGLLLGECVLVTRDRVYHLGRLEPGEERVVSLADLSATRFQGSIYLKGALDR